MIPERFLTKLSPELRLLVGAFMLTLGLGCVSSFAFVQYTTSASSVGIQEQYLGNEADEEAEVMKFKKSPASMLNLVHSHVLSLSLIFLLTGFFTYGARLSKRWRKFIIIEPFASILLTFGGLYLMWAGWTWMVYVVMCSGFLMLSCLALQFFFVFKTLLRSSN